MGWGEFLVLSSRFLVLSSEFRVLSSCERTGVREESRTGHVALLTPIGRFKQKIAPDPPSFAAALCRRYSQLHAAAASHPASLCAGSHRLGPGAPCVRSCLGQAQPTRSRS